MKKTITLVENRILEMQFAKEAVCNIFGWSHGHYATYQYKKGIQYIALYFAGTGSEVDVESSKLFWGWWRNGWLSRDKGFLLESANTPRATLKLAYIDIHNPMLLAGWITPPKAIWADLKQIASLRKQAKHAR